MSQDEKCELCKHEKYCTLAYKYYKDWRCVRYVRADKN